MDYVDALEVSLNKKATKVMLPMQDGDVSETSSDTSLLESWINYSPSTPIAVGIQNFVSWYRKFYSV